MTEQEMEKERFVSGEINVLRLGGYGGTSTVSGDGRTVVVKVTQPKRMQTRQGPDTPDTRRLMLRVAELAVAKAMSPRKQQPRQVRLTVGSDIVTPREIWTSYVTSMVGTVPADVLTWGGRELAAHFQRMTESERNQAPEFDSVSAVLTAARSLHREGAVPLDCDIRSLQPGHLDAYVQRVIAAGRSPHTPKTYTRRFRSAMKQFAQSWPQRWKQDMANPTLAMRVIRTAHIKPEEFGEERTLQLLAALLELGLWRSWATLAIAFESARRVSAISGARTGQHLDAPPLCAADFRQDEQGDLYVMWRAVAQKGRNYDRGDVEQVATRLMASTYRWLVANHPNPYGPERPLIWCPENPRQAASYDALRKELSRAWEHAFNEKRPKGVAWHALCRTTITTLMDELGDVAAAEYSGRTVETVTRIYKRVRVARLKEAAQALDRLRGGQDEAGPLDAGA
jgi:hypothetical protein